MQIYYLGKIVVAFIINYRINKYSFLILKLEAKSITRAQVTAALQLKEMVTHLFVTRGV